MCEHGEKAYRESKKPPPVRLMQEGDLFPFPNESMVDVALRLEANSLSTHMNEFAHRLDSARRPKTAVEVRRFMYDVVDPCTAKGQCQ